MAGAIVRADAGASISGRVVDPQGKAVPGAFISLFARSGNTQEKTTADSSGMYQFQHIAAGDYLIEAKAEGFSAYHVENVHVDRGADVKVDVQLAIANVQQQVVVTSSSTPQTADEVSKAITVVDSQSIDERDSYSLADALSLTPGLHVQQLGGPAAFTTIHLRGLRDQDTAVLVDGLRLRDAGATQADASGLLEDFMVTDLKRVEVLRGSGSSLYGTNAIGGVINVITDNGGGRTRGNILLEGGSLGMFRGRAQMAGGSKGDRVVYSAGVSHLNVTEGVDGEDPARDTSAQGRISFRLSPTIQLVGRIFGVDSFSKVNSSPQALPGLSAGIINAIPLSTGALRSFETGTPLAGLPVGSATYIPAADDPDSTRAAHFITGALMLFGQPSPKLGYTVSYQDVGTYRTYGNGPGGVGYQPVANTYSDYDGRIRTVNAQSKYQLGQYNLVTAGYEFESENFHSRSTAQLSAGSNSSADVTQFSHNTFAQDQMRFFGDRLQLAVAVRAQFFSLDQPGFYPSVSAPFAGLEFKSPPSAYTGDVSAAYFIRRTGTKVRAHAGRGYRSPSLFERFGAGFDQDFGYSIYGDPRLGPERSIAFDGGVDQSFWNGRLRTSATYFYTHLQNVIIFDFSGFINPATDPFGRFGGYRNTKGGLARGVELSADWAVTRELNVSAAYTYTDARERTPIVEGVFRSFITPENQFSVFAVQRIGQRWFVDFALTAASTYLAPIYGDMGSLAYRFPGMRRGDLGASYRLPLSEFRAVRFFGKAENIFDQTYYEGGFRTPGRTARGGLQFEF
jgi:iron complex outermembrane receptor protein